MDRRQMYTYAAITSAIVIICAVLKKKERRRRLWVKPWVSKPVLKGIHQNILKDLRSEGIECYKKFLKMDEDTFNYILAKVTPFMPKQNNNLRSPIKVKDRLLVTLRFLATGENFLNLQHTTYIPQRAISKIIPETCKAIYESMKEDFLKVPTTEDWKTIAKDYEDKWNVVNTIGGIDGKHIRIQCSEASTSRDSVDRSYNSIVLFALVDANCKFIYADVGTRGRIGDTGIFARSKLKRCLANRSTFKLPKDGNLPNSRVVTPYVVLGNDSFPLTYNVMKPHPLRSITTMEERIFNFRLKRGRKMTESAFGILATRFRVLLTAINMSPEEVGILTLAACTLHNLLVDRMKVQYTDEEIYCMDENGVEYLCTVNERSEPLAELPPIYTQTDLGRSRRGKEVRKLFGDFYNGAGGLAWQDGYLEY